MKILIMNENSLVWQKQAADAANDPSAVVEMAFLLVIIVVLVLFLICIILN